MTSVKLPESIASPQDFAAVMTEIKAYSSWAAKAAIKHKVSGKSAGKGPELSPEARAIIHSWSGGKPLSSASASNLLAELERIRKAAKTITITLAAIPTGDVKARLVEWCRKEIDAQIMVNFRFNRSILGGMVVVYGSHIHDWSFRRKIKDSTVSFSEVLHRV